MKLSLGQKIDVEIDREDLELAPAYNYVIATWYHKGNPIYVELETNKTMIKEIWKVFDGNDRKSALFSIFRASEKKYIVEPTMVILNRQGRKGNDEKED